MRVSAEKLAGLSVLVLCLAVPGVLPALAVTNATPAPPAKGAAGKPGQPADPKAAPAAASPYGHLAVDKTADATKDKPAPKGGASSAPPPARAPFAPRVETNPRTGKAVVVIGNTDLERMYGPSAPPAREPAATPYASGGTTPAGAPQAAPAVDSPPPAAASSNTDLQREIERLQQKERFLRNPFLPPPAQSEDERAAEKGMDANQRLQRTQQRIDELKRQLGERQPAAK